MQRLGAQAPEVPDHVWVLQVRLRVSLLAVDEGRELNGKRERGKKTQITFTGIMVSYIIQCLLLGLWIIILNIILEF